MGDRTADVYIKQFDDTFHMLAASPLVRKNCDEVMPGYRRFPQGSHVVFYKNDSGCVIENVRILHKSMDVEMQIYAHNAFESGVLG